MKSVDDVARILNGAGAEYALIGGHAVNVQLEPSLAPRLMRPSA
jgi:hypothetical protein